MKLRELSDSTARRQPGTIAGTIGGTIAGTIGGTIAGTVGTIAGTIGGTTVTQGNQPAPACSTPAEDRLETSL